VKTISGYMNKFGFTITPLKHTTTSSGEQVRIKMPFANKVGIAPSVSENNEGVPTSSIVGFIRR
jgi:hypothetical protein